MTIATEQLTAEPTVEQLQEALRELNEENLDLQDQLDESRRSTTLCIRVLGDLIAEIYPDGITAARGDKPGNGEEDQGAEDGEPMVGAEA